MKMLTIIDEYTRECLAIVVERRLNSEDVLATLFDLFIERGVRNTSDRIMGLSLQRKQ